MKNTDSDNDDVETAKIEAEINLIRKELDNLPSDHDSYYEKLFEISERLNAIRDKIVP